MRVEWDLELGKVLGVEVVKVYGLGVRVGDGLLRFRKWIVLVFFLFLIFGCSFREGVCFIVGGGGSFEGLFLGVFEYYFGLFVFLFWR